MTKIIMVAGLAFGDEGKGTIVDYLTRVHNAKYVIRFNGGAQAAHNVVLPDSTHHTFAQFGSGTLAGARTYLGEHMMVNPLTLIAEWHALDELVGGSIRDWITINYRALITNRYHVAANRIRETVRGEGRHGSCGMGIGETMSDHIEHPELDITMGTLMFPEESKLRDLLKASRELKLKQLEEEIEKLWEMPDSEARQSALGELNVLRSNRILEQILGRYAEFGRLGINDNPQDRKLGMIMQEASERHPVIFEGAQGALLDENYGFHPFTTWSDTTWRHAMKICADHNMGQFMRRIGVVRTYYTRHGAGPFPSESDGLYLTEKHNQNTPWQQAFRVGHFDPQLLEYGAFVLGGISEVALTHMDVWNDSIRYVYEYWTGSGRGPVKTPYEKNVSPTLEWQKCMTARVKNFDPQTWRLDSLEDLISYIEETLAFPVTIGSWGPTCADKRYLK